MWTSSKAFIIFGFLLVAGFLSQPKGAYCVFDSERFLRYLESNDIEEELSRMDRLYHTGTNDHVDHYQIEEDKDLCLDHVETLQQFLSGFDTSLGEQLGHCEGEVHQLIQQLHQIFFDHLIYLQEALNQLEIQSHQLDSHLLLEQQQNVAANGSNSGHVSGEPSGHTMGEVSDQLQAQPQPAEASMIRDENMGGENDNGMQTMPRRCRGRKKLSIDITQVNGLKELGFTWEKISQMLGINERTLRRRRKQISDVFVKSRTEISDIHLQEQVRDVIEQSPNSGERMIIGALRARGTRAQRWRVREAIRVVDPIGCILRQQKRSIVRRIYSVPCPNALWHADGNHKLIHWRIVIHGAIDGFSRTIVFLRCSTNNQADTVLTYFLQAIRQYRCPLRIRTDHGTENIFMARWMLEHHGLQNRPVLTGLSVHNQRIERLWVDVYNYVLDHFRNVFYYLEENHLLDRTDELDLFALHFIFVPRIQSALDDFVSSWNNHPLSSESSNSPLQVWIEGFYRYATNDRTCVRDLLDHTSVDWGAYGIDELGPVPELQTSNNVVVPRSAIELDAVELVLLQESVRPLDNDNDFGISLYETCRQTVRTILTFRPQSG